MGTRASPLLPEPSSCGKLRQRAIHITRGEKYVTWHKIWIGNVVDCWPNSDCAGRARRHSDTVSPAHTYAYANPHSNIHTDLHIYPYANRHAHSHTDRHTHSHANRHTHSYTDRHAHS